MNNVELRYTESVANCFPNAEYNYSGEELPLQVWDESNTQNAQMNGTQVTRVWKMHLDV